MSDAVDYGQLTAESHSGREEQATTAVPWVSRLLLSLTYHFGKLTGFTMTDVILMCND